MTLQSWDHAALLLGPLEVFVLLPRLLRKQVREPALKNVLLSGFPGGAVVKNPPANAGDTGSSPGPGRSHMPRSN